MSEEDWRKISQKNSAYYPESNHDADVSEAQASASDQQSPSEATSSEATSSEATSSKEWQLISHLVQDIHKEKVRSRRWGVLFKSLAFIIVLSFIAKAWHTDIILPVSSDHVAVIKVEGVVSADSPSSAQNILANVERAFEQESAKAIVLEINSPGGSPVQAGIIYDEIMRLKSLHPAKPVYAVITDIGTSGAYYVAVAADTIYADKASLVGSIGVIASGFGFTHLISNLGIERRTYTAGSNKDFLDPFRPEKPQQKQAMDDILDKVHKQFITIVKTSRADRLEDDDEIFSGLFWVGEQALNKGLIDNLGSIYDLAREEADSLPLQVYRSPKTPYQEIIEQLGVAAAHRINSYFSQPGLY